MEKRKKLLQCLTFYFTGACEINLSISQEKIEKEKTKEINRISFHISQPLGKTFTDRN